MRFSWLVVFATASLMLSCGTSTVCSPTTCAGCCEASGCTLGTSTLACGRGGAVCSVCGVGACVNGTCQSQLIPGGGGGGTSGGTAGSGVSGGVAGTGGGQPQSGSPTGNLWHKFTTLDIDWSSATQIASLEGANNRYVTSGTAYPWPDGTQYVQTTFDSSDTTTRLVVFDRTSMTATVDVWLDGYWQSADPCPSDRNVAKFVTSETSTGPSRRVLLDLRTQTVIKEVPNTRTFSWTADGHFVTVNDAGEIRLGSVTEAERLVGQLPALPAGHSIGSAIASHDGRKLVVRLGWDDGATRFNDLWIANVDGSGFAQLTDTHAGLYAHWSPDDRFIAIEIDTGFVCASGGCNGGCELWYTTPDQRSVKALNGTSGTARFEVKNRHGSSRRQVTCGILEWLR